MLRTSVPLIGALGLTEAPVKFLVTAVIGLFAGLALAQEPDETFTSLMNAHSVRCFFGAGTEASWSPSGVKLGKASAESMGPVTYDSINLKSQSARIIGNMGVDNVLVIGTASGITFMEKTGFGNLNFTTVFARVLPTDKRTYIAVTSRHQDSDAPHPSQYHGACKILE